MSIEELHFGLKYKVIERINDIFYHHPEIDTVIIYGSRAMGNYRNGSDIDLTILSNTFTYQQLNRIETELDDLLLPYSIDLSLFKQIDNPDLIDHINRVGKIFYTRTRWNKENV